MSADHRVSRARATRTLYLELDRHGDTLRVCLRGDWTVEHLAQLERALRDITPRDCHSVEFAGGDVAALDLSGAWLLLRTSRLLTERGLRTEFSGFQGDHLGFLDRTVAAENQPRLPVSEAFALVEGVESLGRWAAGRASHAAAALAFLGRSTTAFLAGLVQPRHLRFPTVVHQLHQAAVTAVPVVALIAFLIAVVIAYMGSQQLRQFGAEIFTVDLVAIAMLREMGVLLTAIMVAGRTGSAFAAEVGVMRRTEEGDALRTRGVNPYEALAVPRVLALVLALPLLTVVADALGLAGGALVLALLLDISVAEFVSRLETAITGYTFWVGIIKAPVFGAIIGLVATLRGMQVRVSAESLGHMTTVAVVESIFLVILADAIFAVLFMELGI